MAVTIIDESLEVQGLPRRLAQEPDRGESLRACIGASDEGFLLATAVEGGRGRLLWLDRRATPLGARYVEGFSGCSSRRSGLRVQVAMTAEDALTITDLGAAARPGPDAGPPESSFPDAPEHARLAALSTGADGAVLLVGDSDSVEAHATSRGQPVQVFAGRPISLSAASSGDGTYALAIIDGQVGAAQLGSNMEVIARGTELSEAEAAWIAVRDEEPPSVAWLSRGILQLRSLHCGTDGERSEGEEQTVGPSALDAADRRDAASLRALARGARARDKSYRAAWLLERAYDLDRTEPAALRDAAALLTKLRYTQAARRILSRLSKVESAEARALLRSTCRDSDFERQWRLGEYQRITGCPAPRKREPAPDAGSPAEAAPE
jgi:hypothetical protein